MGKLPVPFWGRYFHILNNRLPERLFLAGDAVLYGVDMHLGEIRLPGKKGIRGRREKHLTIKRLRDAVERIPGKAEVRGAKARGRELGKLLCSRIIAVKGVYTVKVRHPLQAPVTPVKVHKFLDGRLQFRAPASIPAYTVNAVSAFRNA